MNRKSLLFVSIMFLMSGYSLAQIYSIIIKGGHIIDPKNKIDGIMDLAIHDGKIALVAKNIDVKEGKKVLDARNIYVTPGIIDLHTHVYYGTKIAQGLMNGPNSVAPDAFSFRAGVTPFVDTGSSGWRSFPDFKRQTIDNSQTRVLAFLNIVGDGMGSQLESCKENCK